MRLTKQRLLLASAAWFCVCNLAIIAGVRTPLLSGVAVFGFLSIVPGLLAIVAFRLRFKRDILLLYYAVCFSLLFLMLVGLFINTLLPLVGIHEPLQTRPLTVSIDVLLLVLGVAAWKYGGFDEVEWPLRPVRLLWALLPSVFVILGIFGAVSLNNGATNIFTVIMYWGALAYLAFLVLWRRQDTAAIAAAIFWIALGLLFATSLRGWYITGHDIQREYYVFQLTKQNWHWDVSLLRDPYNACLSITILPTIFSSLMKMNDVYIYKVLFQILFALCPVAVYMLFRRISNARWALLGSIYFIAFPTFLGDMPMLNRQEIAFMFFAAMLLMMFKEHIALWQRRTLFLVFGLGVVVSHYSTTYAMLGIFTLAALIGMLIRWPATNRLAQRFIKALRGELPDFAIIHERQFVLIPMIILLALASFTWSSQLTKTSSGVVTVVVKTIQGISGNIKDEAKSTDTKASIFSWSRPDTTATFNHFVKSDVASARAKSIPGEYYSVATVRQYPLRLVNEETAPYTGVGRWVAKVVSPFTANYILRQGFAKLLQILLVIGAVAIFLKRRYSGELNRDFVGLMIASIIFVGSLVVLPNLTLEYGLLRAFQQILMLVGLPLVIGSVVVCSPLPRKVTNGAVVGLALLFFASMTGLIAQLTGGYYYPLELYNNGAYYDDYYFHSTEIASIQWLAKERVSTNNIQTDVEADRFSFSKIHTVGNFSSTSDIFPGAIKQDSYVYLSYANVVKHRAYAIYQNDSFTYVYPIAFLEQHKNLVYNDGTSEVYK